MSRVFEYAVQLCPDTAEDIIQFAENNGWDLEAEIHSYISHGAGTSRDVYVNMVWDYVRAVPISFETFPGYTFDACWRFSDGMRGPFQRIVKS